MSTYASILVRNCLPPFHVAFSGESFILFDCRIFLCFPILDDSFCLFLCFLIFHFANCLCRMNFYVGNFMGFSSVVSLNSLSGLSKVALSSFCVGSLLYLGLYVLVVPVLVASLLQWVY